MHRRLAALVLVSALVWTGAAMAADPSPSDPTLLMNPTPLPVTSQGRLVNYIFVTLRLICRPGSDMARIRGREPFFRDALVRRASRVSLAMPDGIHVDPVKLKAAILQDAPAIVGPGVVVDVKIVKEQPKKPFVAPAG